MNLYGLKLNVSFVDNPNDMIKIVVWSKSNPNNPLGICKKELPLDEDYNQTMITNWISLTSANEQEGYGRVRLGIQYIYDQVKFIELIMDKKNEEFRIANEEYDRTRNILRETYEPFDILIFEEAQREVVSAPDPLLTALGPISAALEKPLEVAEDYVTSKARGLRPASMKWSQLFTIGTLVYAVLSSLIAFHRQDMVNVEFCGDE
jgi:hypothetical protein